MPELAPVITVILPIRSHRAANSDDHCYGKFFSQWFPPGTLASYFAQTNPMTRNLKSGSPAMAPPVTEFFVSVVLRDILRSSHLQTSMARRCPQIASIEEWCVPREGVASHEKQIARQPDAMYPNNDVCQWFDREEVLFRQTQRRLRHHDNDRAQRFEILLFTGVIDSIRELNQTSATIGTN
jgi:hypothetical protein